MRELADRLNTSASTVNKLEKGQTQLTVNWMQRLSQVFNVPVPSLIEDQDVTSTGFREDAKLWPDPSGSIADIKLADGQFIYEAKTSVLDQIGIRPGTALIVDQSPAAMRTLKSEDVVIAQHYDGTHAETLLRQFVAPSLLITNSSTDNDAIINLRSQDVVIKGVVVASHNVFRPAAKPFDTAHGKP